MSRASDIAAGVPEGARSSSDSGVAPEGARNQDAPHKAARSSSDSGVAPEGARNQDAPQQEQLDPVDELRRLFPEEPLGVHDPDTGEIVPLKVREFSFAEELEVTATARPIARALAALVERGAAAEAELPALFEFHDAIAANAEAWLALIAAACGREAGWIARLNHKDARRMNDAMWSANGPFLFDMAGDALGMGSRTARLFHSFAYLMRSSAQDTGAATAT